MLTGYDQSGILTCDMKLNQYLAGSEKRQSEIAKAVGVAQATISRYANGLRIPTPEIMARIVAATDGQVTPNDFYDVARPPAAPAVEEAVA